MPWGDRSRSREGDRAASPMIISSPVPRSPDPAYFDDGGPSTPRGSPVRDMRNGRRPLPATPRGRGGGYDDYDLSVTASPTHAYLEHFDSYPSTPDPSHTPIPGSPASPRRMESPGWRTNDHEMAEKEPLENAFGRHQYASDRFLAPTSTRDYHYANATRRNLTPQDVRRRGYKKRTCVPQNRVHRRLLFWGVPILLLVGAGAAVGVVFGLKAGKTGSGGGAGGGSGGSGGAGTNGGGGTGGSGYNQTQFGIASSGGAGTVVTTDQNVQFTYQNTFGGYWAQNPGNPYSVSGRAQSWVPALTEPWVWGRDIVRGVNIGGWLVTEPFIVPALYEQYQNTTPQAIDEFTLSQAMGSNLAAKMEEHYSTFITEEEFALIASAGLNWVRIPIGYWAIETRAGEPYLEGVSWNYFTRAIGWARKYGLRILLDFHALPGSQNGWNHSGRGIGIVNWMYGIMGLSNAQRSLEQIRTMVEFISQEGIKEVVPAISLVNEVQASVVGDTNLRTFYYNAYNMIRGITGYGSGNGPYIMIHEGFEGIASWAGFLSGADRLALDQHPYLAFVPPNNNPYSQQTLSACGWGGGTNDSQTNFGVTIGGEWSNAINDCGLWLTGVNGKPSFASVVNCTQFDEWFNWDITMKTDILNYSAGNMDALQNWFFWTWKIGNSTVLGYPSSPMWHYKLGWQNGWILSDPRKAGGYCKGIGVGGNQFAGTFPASATGAVSTAVAPANTSLFVWPPTSMGPSFTANQIALFPTLTQTGSPVTLATLPHPTNATMVGSGWENTADTAKAYTTVAGCTYPERRVQRDCHQSATYCSMHWLRRRGYTAGAGGESEGGFQTADDGGSLGSSFGLVTGLWTLLGWFGYGYLYI